ncbi:hypothetical protein U1Q18_048194 [Sarracenia purpurea var. burkii]
MGKEDVGKKDDETLEHRAYEVLVAEECYKEDKDKGEQENFEMISRGGWDLGLGWLGWVLVGGLDLSCLVVWVVVASLVGSSRWALLVWLVGVSVSWLGGLLFVGGFGGEALVGAACGLVWSLLVSTWGWADLEA